MFAWHKFGRFVRRHPEVGSRADCGFVVTQEWVDARQEPPTTKNTCPDCRAGLMGTSDGGL